MYKWGRAKEVNKDYQAHAKGHRSQSEKASVSKLKVRDEAIWAKIRKKVEWNIFKHSKYYRKMNALKKSPR